MRLVFTLLMLLMGGIAFAEQPVAAITGPETQVEIGDLVELDASKSVGQGLLWKSIDLPAERFRLYDNGKKLCFAAKSPGRLRFMLIVAGVSDGEDKGLVIVTAEHSVDVKGSVPAPDPTPGPRPDPVPVDNWGLRKSIAEWSVLVTGERHLAPQLASNYRTISRLALAGKLDVKGPDGKVDFIGTAQAMNSAIGATNAALPAAARPHWLPLITKLNARMTSLCEMQTGIQTVPKLAEAFEDIAAGFDAIKK